MRRLGARGVVWRVAMLSRKVFTHNEVRLGGTHWHWICEIRLTAVDSEFPLNESGPFIPHPYRPMSRSIATSPHDPTTCSTTDEASEKRSPEQQEEEEEHPALVGLTPEVPRDPPGGEPENPTKHDSPPRPDGKHDLGDDPDERTGPVPVEDPKPEGRPADEGGDIEEPDAQNPSAVQLTAGAASAGFTPSGREMRPTSQEVYY